MTQGKNKLCRYEARNVEYFGSIYNALMSGRQENQIARQTALAVQPGYSDNSSRHLLVGWELTKLVVRTSQGIASHRWANEASRGKNTNREHTRGWKMSASLPDISEQQAATQVLLQAYEAHHPCNPTNCHFAYWVWKCERVISGLQPAEASCLINWNPVQTHQWAHVQALVWHCHLWSHTCLGVWLQTDGDLWVTRQTRGSL